MSQVSLDVELLIRILEWAREEAGDDVDLHDIAERLETLTSSSGRSLVMADYPAIVGGDHQEPVLPTRPVGLAQASRVRYVTRNELKRIGRKGSTNLASYNDPKEVVCKYTGDFDLPGLLQHLWYLGKIGASRDVTALDKDEQPVQFGFDGDGADKITHVIVNGTPLINEGNLLEEFDTSASISNHRVSNMRLFALRRMLRMEARASNWWSTLSEKEKKVYIQAHPRSKYAKQIGGKMRAVKAALATHGWESAGTNAWKHPKTRHKITFRPSDEHKHHLVVTKANGEVSEHKTNSDDSVNKIIGGLSKSNTAGISKALKEQKGSLHEHLGIEKGQPLPLGKLQKLADSDHPLARRARLVLNLKRAKKRGPIDYTPAR